MERYAKGDYLKALSQLVPWPADDANKYSRGKVEVFAGSAVYPGAACLCSYAAQRAGAGYVEVHCDPGCVSLVQASRPSLVVRPWTDLSGVLWTGPTESRPRAFVVGPGFDSGDEATRAVLHSVLDRCEAPLVIDGGALTMLADEDLRILVERRADRGLSTALTPHGGEAARLARYASVSLPEKDQEEATMLLASRYGCAVLLKGPDTVCSDGQRCAVMDEGTSALAKAGTGDVLAGVVAALLGQGLPVFEGALLASLVHARAGIAAASSKGSIGVVPEDVIEGLAAAFESLAVV